jgi:nucleoid-associated protein YgaU
MADQVKGGRGNMGDIDKEMEEIRRRREKLAKEREAKASKGELDIEQEVEDIRKQNAAARGKAEPTEAEETAEVRTYVVNAGDSLSKIAERVYGDASRWREIYKANKDQIEDPKLIRPGWELRIP